MTPEHLWHFGDHDSQISRFVGVAAIPIRDPVEILCSWAVRERDPKEAVQRIKAMFAYIAEHPEARLYKTEDLPHRLGHREAPGRSPSLAVKLLRNNLSREQLDWYENEHGYAI